MDFKYNNENKTKILASYLPDGKSLEAKNIPSKNIYKFLDAIAKNFVLFETDIQNVIKEMNPATTEDLISMWEKEYGLPNACMPIATTLEQRRTNILIKIGMNGIQTIPQYLALFQKFGFPIEIYPYGYLYVYPFDILGYPIILSDQRYNKFTIEVRLPKAFNEEVYDFSTNGYPIILLNELNQTFIECLLKRLVPANVNIVFRYVL